MNLHLYQAIGTFRGKEKAFMNNWIYPLYFFILSVMFFTAFININITLKKIVEKGDLKDKPIERRWTKTFGEIGFIYFFSCKHLNIPI